MEKIEKDVVVLGAGPGGYAAAFYASSHGLDVMLIDSSEKMGGVCLNEGCIPSKALIHATEVMKEAEHSAEFGIFYSKPKVDLDKLRSWKNSIISKLNQGVSSLCKMKNVSFMKGRGYFQDNNTLRVETDNGQEYIAFKHCIIAVGSKPAMPAAFDLGNKRIMTSKEALEMNDIPNKMLVVGGGYIGMELGMVYATLGSKVSLIEAMDSILLGADSDIVKPVLNSAKKAFEKCLFNSKVTKMSTKLKQIHVEYDTGSEKKEELFDKVLISVGRSPNSDNLGLENTDVCLDDKKFIQVDDSCRTAAANIYAIGDIAGGILLAHKASKEAKVAVDAMIGQKVTKKDVVIPAVVFTDPEIAWCGLTEIEAKSKGIKVDVSKFPWAASGRAMSLNRTEGFTKLILEPVTHRVLGVSIVGARAAELIAEGCLAVELGATAEDLSDVVHPHPTLSETVMESAELFFGHSAHAFNSLKETKKVS